MADNVSLFGRARYFLRKHIVHGRVRVFLQWIFAKFQALFIQPTILPYFVTFFPYKQSSYAYKLDKTRGPAPRGPHGLPVPPEKLWLGYGRTAAEWVESGRVQVETMRSILSDSGYAFEPGHRVLELGCAGARMMRQLEDVADRCEIWGADISGEHIAWCKQHLTPPFHFFTTTQYPHLPFPDEYFNVIYAGSVFTHIDDLADAWMLELRRTMTPGGRLYVTMHDEHTIRVLSEGRDKYDLAKTLYCRRDFFEDGNYNMFTIGRFMRSQVFYDSKYHTDRWKPFFETTSITPEAYAFQTGYLLTRI